MCHLIRESNQTSGPLTGTSPRALGTSSSRSHPLVLSEDGLGTLAIPDAASRAPSTWKPRTLSTSSLRTWGQRR